MQPILGLLDAKCPDHSGVPDLVGRHSRLPPPKRHDPNGPLRNHCHGKRRKSWSDKNVLCFGWIPGSGA